MEVVSVVGTSRSDHGFLVSLSMQPHTVCLDDRHRLFKQLSLLSPAAQSNIR